MALVLPDAWSWDMWLIDDGERFHVFYLKASRALLAEHRRHLRATVGHAVSDDLRHWTEFADAFVTSDGPAFDDMAIWTGSMIGAPDGTWRFLYTGCSRAEDGQVQRTGLATSDDLVTWHRVSERPVMTADPRWYGTLATDSWEHEAWRDPWVFRDPSGDGWHAILTARATDGPVDERGVIGHATSPDLREWTVRPPLSATASGFGQLECPQVLEVDGRGVLIFSCFTPELSAERRARGEQGGIWAVPVDSLTGPYDITRATLLTDESLYAGKLQRDRAGAWWLLAFDQREPGKGFVGGLVDPLPVGWTADGRLHVTDGRFDHLAPVG